MTPAQLDAAAVSEGQRKLLTALGTSPLADVFYLSGGTALASFYLRHRVSRDLDLFTNDEVPLETIRSFLETVPGLRVDSYQKRFDRKIFLIHVDDEALEVEFTKYDFERLSSTVRLDAGLQVDDPIDILANKIAAVVDRFEPKDQVDLYFLLNASGMPSFREALELTGKKFGIPGLRYLVQARLLAAPKHLPATTPPLSPEDLARNLRALVDELIADDAEP